MIEQRGLVVGPSDLLAKLPGGAFVVTSWQHGKSPKTQEATFARLRELSATGESKFDAAHGFRYLLFVYRTREERKACFDFLTGGLDQ